MSEGTGPVPNRPAKRLLDLVVASVLLVLLAPVFLFALAAIGLDNLFVAKDRGGWFYRERRISRGREFDLLKFRVLRRAALAELRSRPGAYARQYERDESNLTWAGRALKRAYLDELPQLFAVLRGQMSLVGPRPWPIAMVEDQLANGLDYRNKVPAGWTGPAQVLKDSTGKANATALDLAYVEACRTMSSLRLVRYDIGLLSSSLATMLRGRGLRY